VVQSILWSEQIFIEYFLVEMEALMPWDTRIEKLVQLLNKLNSSMDKKKVFKMWELKQLLVV
jgi:hypothetical protein